MIFASKIFRKITSANVSSQHGDVPLFGMVKENLGLSKSFLLPAAVCPRHSPNICVQNPTITKLIFHHNAIFIYAHLFRLMIDIRDISLIFTVAKIECQFF